MVGAGEAECRQNENPLIESDVDKSKAQVRGFLFSGVGCDALRIPVLTTFWLYGSGERELKGAEEAGMEVRRRGKKGAGGAGRGQT